jgi:ribonuclease HII
MSAEQLASRTLIVGVDEAGRGALAGPVVAGACILPERRQFPVRIGDSKKMSPADREESYEWLVKECVTGFGMVDAAEIDRIGILAATEIAMQRAVEMVAATAPNLYILVDGRDAFWFNHPHSSIIRGDDSERCIGAASIIAKVTRDRHMVALQSEYPQYGFAVHKGYGTPEHYAAITKNGIAIIHRKTFLSSL